ncbi:MAG TPA: hypothetical protein VNJ04_12010 [Gemmatimonadaceae bacterium]|nr:hypothetical protein [Gemmatimonadaceae bacterium]
MGWAERANQTAQYVKNDPESGRWMRVGALVRDHAHLDELLARVPPHERDRARAKVSPFLTFPPETDA